MPYSKFKKALVTGGAGFIGSHIARQLLDEGIETVIVDDLSTGNTDNIPDGARFHKGSILDSSLLKQALLGVDVVFHNAARVSIRDSFESVSEDASTNVLGTITLLKAAGAMKVKKFIYASSMAVYGYGAAVPAAESSVLKPLSPYGAGKLAAEMYTGLICNSSGLDYAILRYFNTFGIRQSYTPYVGVITIFATELLQGKPPVIFADGAQRRDFVHVEDIARANILAMRSPRSSGIYNIGTGKGTSVNEVADILIGKIRPGTKPRHAAAQNGEPGDSIADVSAAESVLGFTPRYTLKDRIDEVIEWNLLRLSAC